MAPTPTTELERLASRDLAEPTPVRRFERAAAGWLIGCRTRNTRAAYERDLRDWLAYTAEIDLDPWNVERAHLDLYARRMEEERGLAASTVARRLSALSSLYDYLLDEDPDLIDGRNPLDRVTRPTVSKDSNTRGLDRDEAFALLDAAEDAGHRDHALACLLMLSGLRVSEAVGVDVDDLDEARGYRIVKLTRKGGKVSTRRLASRTAGAIDAYLDWRRITTGDASGALLRDDEGDRLDRHQAARIVRRLARRAGVRKRITPHSLRHTAATLALDAGVPLRDVQDMLDHTDPATTRRYDRARQSLDRDPTERISAYIATGAA